MEIRTWQTEICTCHTHSANSHNKEANLSAPKEKLLAELTFGYTHVPFVHSNAL